MRASQSSRAKYPLATISAYGPDNRRATKLVVSILRRTGQKDADPMRTWNTDAGDVRNDPAIAAEAREFDDDGPIEPYRAPQRIGRNEPCVWQREEVQEVLRNMT